MALRSVNHTFHYFVEAQNLIREPSNYTYYFIILYFCNSTSTMKYTHQGKDDQNILTRERMTKKADTVAKMNIISALLT